MTADQQQITPQEALAFLRDWARQVAPGSPRREWHRAIIACVERLQDHATRAEHERDEARGHVERLTAALREIELHSNGHLGWGLDSDPYFQAIAKPGRIARQALAAASAPPGATEPAPDQSGRHA